VLRYYVNPKVTAFLDIPDLFIRFSFIAVTSV
jgi:hypothetical protein